MLKFFPDDASYLLTAMSDRALAYSDEPLESAACHAPIRGDGLMMLYATAAVVIHPDCCLSWEEQRRRQAVTYLERCGIKRPR